MLMVLGYLRWTRVVIIILVLLALRYHEPDAPGGSSELMIS